MSSKQTDIIWNTCGDEDDSEGTFYEMQGAGRMRKLYREMVWKFQSVEGVIGCLSARNAQLGVENNGEQPVIMREFDVLQAQRALALGSLTGWTAAAPCLNVSICSAVASSSSSASHV